MHIFITGAAGFIGFHLALDLKRKGHSVLGYDNFNAYYDVGLKKARAQILEEAGVQVIHGDIRDEKLLGSLLINHPFTHFVHLAAQAGVRHSLKEPHDYVAANLSGFVSVLEAIKCYPQIKFVFASSSSVYGLNTKVPFAPQDPTDRPANLYGATKKANELIAFAYHNLFGIPMTGLRFFTVYGPWGRPDMAYFSFTKNILEGKPIRLFNYGKMSRDFTYIDDIVAGVESALKYDSQFEIFNLGNNHPEELMDMVRYLEENLGKKALLEPVAMRKEEVVSTYADIDKSAKLLRFTPKTSLKEGLLAFTEWYLAQYS